MSVDISTELAAILAAIYGEEVRGSIHDALLKMNNNLNTAIGNQLLTIDDTLTATDPHAAADSKKVGDIINTISGMVAFNYNPASSYAVGDYCSYGNSPTTVGRIYRCTTAIGSGGEVWNADHWQRIDFANRIGEIIQYLFNKIATIYDPTKAYSVGDFCTHGNNKSDPGRIYRCNTAIGSGGEAWNASHWTLVNLADVVADEFSELKDVLNAASVTDWTHGAYYAGSSSITNVKPTDAKTESPNFDSALVDCFADDVFYLTGKGGSGAKLWLWTKNNGDVISRAASNAVADNLRLTPPNDARYLYIAVQNGRPYSLTKVKSVDERIADAIGDFLGAEKIESWTRYKYITTNGTTVDVNSPVDGYANSYVILSCSEGDTFVITGRGSSGARLYCFTDSSYNVLVKASSSYNTVNEVITAPADTAYLIVNVNHYRYYALYKLRSNSFGTLLNGRVAVLENAVDALPDYLEDEAKDTADKIKNACTEGAYVIGFVTDSHYGISNSAFTTNWDTTAKTLKRVNELRRFDLLIHGGDMVDGNVAKADTSAILSRFVSDLRAVNADAQMLTGNHDDNLTYYRANGTGFINRADRRALYANGIEGTRFSNYSAWYKDIPWLGLRVIGLDYLMDDSTYADHGYWGFTTEQIEWVRDTALNTSSQVVFFSHGPCTKEYGYGRNGVPTTVYNGDTLRGVIESFISNGGTVVGFFHGHTHWDFIGQYSQTNGFREVSIGRSVMDTWTIANITYHPEGVVFEEKTIDTVTQELWDTIIIKPQSRVVNIIRFGAGSDRTFTY